MYYEISRENLQAIMTAQGEVRGSVLQKDEKFVLQNGGRAKLKAVENEIKEMGYNLSYKDIKKNNFYPWGYRILSLLAISFALKRDSKKMKEMGVVATKKGKLCQLLERKFFDIEKILQRTVKKWRKNNTVGRLEIIEVNKTERIAVVRLYNLNYHLIFCDYFAGELEGLGQNTEGDGLICKETKCYFRGEDFFHEFMLKW